MLKISVLSILSIVGESLNINEELKIDNISVGRDAVKVNRPISIKGVFTNIGGNIFDFEGSVSTGLNLFCDRCMCDVDYEMDFSVSERFSSGFDECSDEEIKKINGHVVDLTDIVLEGIVINIPMKVLCDPKCKGLCSKCGANLNKISCECDTTNIDPRFEVLKDFFNNN